MAPENIADARVLVTGCAGFLGPWVCELLLERGATVVGLDRQYPQSSRIHELSEKFASSPERNGSGSGKLKLVNVDIEHYQKVFDVIKDNDIQVIFHLAAQAIVGVANENPVPTFASNIQGTWNILEAVRLLRQAGQSIESIVVASSDKAYGDQEVLPYLEDAPMQGRFPYDVSKSCADLITRSYFHSFALPVAVTRCGNLYGGGDLNFSRIVPGTIQSVLAGQAPLIRSDGSPVRDYIYVQDAARANLAIAERLLQDKSIAGQAFNISNDAPVSVLTMVDEILKNMQRSDLKPVVEGRATREIQAQYLSSERIRGLGWSPRYSLAEGLAEAIAWYREHLSVGAQV
ncbi:MAG TPA: GDP-mannose 4,6-dehydratase [Candidatus Obscuribacter sp.]|nr:GDP-mannose 4,6-dehydratase [Candidatus Obscuribacter sp.]